MNITKESTGELTALLKVEVTEDDYLEKVNKALKDYQRKANVPGFRPGKVPFGMMKKMYGTSVMADEVNKLVSEELRSFLRASEQKTLGYPIPNDKKTSEVDWSSQGNFDLFFDIGFAPEFELNLSDGVLVDYYKIKVNEQQVDDEIKRLADEYANVEKVDSSEINDWITGDIIQLGEDGNIIKNGFNHDTYIHPLKIKDETQQARFIGLKTGDVVEFDLRTVFPENDDAARLLRMTEKEALGISGLFRFVVEQISRVTPAEMNATFFAKVFPDHEEELDEAEFRRLVTRNLEKAYEPESDKKFMQDAVDSLIEGHGLNLPEDFLKRWMLESNREEVTREEIEKDFPKLIRSLKWDMIKQKITKQHNIKVSDEDVRTYVKSYFIAKFGQDTENEDGRMQEFISRILSKEEDAERIETDIFNMRMLQVMKDNLKLNIKETSVEDFIDLVNNTCCHDHDHEDHHHY